MTIVASGSEYVSVTMDSVLTGCDRRTTLHRKDGNPLNVTRANLQYATPTQHTTIANGDVTYLLLDNAVTVVIDTDRVEQVTRYRWCTRLYRGRVQIVARKKSTDGVQRIQLPRLLLGLSPYEKRAVQFRNGDRYDCRLSNLTISEKPQCK